ncbi:TetR/AcrR family transcriptional regulator [Agromyces sp. NPDC049794]|uniref:TetR/AcrR family transcriptional regulator n=1 Tax=unclassified Agromyces TaxID=2639701 RepID=UPI00340C1C35
MTSKELSGIGQRRATALFDGSPEYTAKRAELIAAAARVFRRKGYGQATLNDIASEFGTDRASLYYYVSSKEELFHECVTGLTAENLRRAEIIVAEVESPRERLKALITSNIESQVEHYPYMYVYVQEIMGQVASIEAPWAREMVEITHSIEQCFIQAIEAGKQAGQFRSELSTTLVANAIFGMTQWTHRWWAPPKSRYDAATVSETFIEVFLEGISAR